MKWIYLAAWGLLLWRDIPPRWKQGKKKETLLWLAAAGLGLALTLWLFWGQTQWRLAEWVLGG